MSNFARNEYGLGKAVTFNVITPMSRAGTRLVKVLLTIFDWRKQTQKTAKELSFLPFVHWVVIKRDEFPHLVPEQPKEELNYDYLFFLSTFNGPWGPYTPSPTFCTSRSTPSGSGATVTRSRGRSRA